MVTIALPDEVTTEDVWEARNLLENELLGDFPFDGQASRANALGAMLVPFLRDSIEGPTPLHLIDKPEAGTGAGLLAACISIPGAGPNVESSQWSHKEDERRKTILSVLADGRTVVLWDNVEGPITSPTLNSMLTQPIFSDRRLNTNNAVGYAVRCLHLMTANNGKPSEIPCGVSCQSGWTPESSTRQSGPGRRRAGRGGIRCPHGLSRTAPNSCEPCSCFAGGGAGRKAACAAHRLRLIRGTKKSWAEC